MPTEGWKIVSMRTEVKEKLDQFRIDLEGMTRRRQSISSTIDWLIDQALETDDGLGTGE